MPKASDVKKHTAIEYNNSVYISTRYRRAQYLKGEQGVVCIVCVCMMWSTGAKVDETFQS